MGGSKEPASASSTVSLATSCLSAQILLYLHSSKHVDGSRPNGHTASLSTTQQLLPGKVGKAGPHSQKIDVDSINILMLMLSAL